LKNYLPENLQMHMLRVAACSNLIMDNWIEPEIDKIQILTRERYVLIVTKELHQME
jgi:hypothetical protein